MIEGLRNSPQLDIMVRFLIAETGKRGIVFDNTFHARITETLEAMVRDGWVKPKIMDGVPLIQHEYPRTTASIRPNVPGR